MKYKNKKYIIKHKLKKGDKSSIIKKNIYINKETIETLIFISKIKP